MWTANLTFFYVTNQLISCWIYWTGEERIRKISWSYSWEIRMYHKQKNQSSLIEIYIINALKELIHWCVFFCFSLATSCAKKSIKFFYSFMNLYQQQRRKKRVEVMLAMRRWRRSRTMPTSEKKERNDDDQEEAKQKRISSECSHCAASAARLYGPFPLTQVTFDDLNSNNNTPAIFYNL